MRRLPIPCAVHPGATYSWSTISSPNAVRATFEPVKRAAASRKVDGVALDNCFDGWDGHAAIAWPSRRLKLALEASQPFRHLVIYVPPGRDFFCVEPVSHANGLVGLSPLGPGATLAGEIVFRIFNL